MKKNSFKSKVFSVILSMAIIMAFAPFMNAGIIAYASAGWRCNCENPADSKMHSEFGDFISAQYHQERVVCETCGAHSEWVEGFHIDLNGDSYCDLCNYDKNGKINAEAKKQNNSGGNNGNGGSGSGSGSESGGSDSSGGKSSGEGEGGSKSDSSKKQDKIAKIPTAKDLTYTGKKQIGVPAGTGYSISGHKGTNAGTYKAKATLKAGYKWSDNTRTPKTIKWTIKKAPNPGKVKYNKTPTVKYSKLKKADQKIAAKKMFQMNGAVGKISYSKSSGNKKIGINKKTGELVLKKGLSKGTYTVKLKVTAAGNKNYKKGTKTVTVKVIVK